MNRRLPHTFRFLGVFTLAGLFILISTASAGDMAPVQMQMKKREPITIIQQKGPLEPPLEKYLPINVNTTDIYTLKKVPGISRRAARDIVNYRDKNGKYTSLDQLVGFPGIRESDIAELKKYLTLE